MKEVGLTVWELNAEDLRRMKRESPEKKLLVYDVLFENVKIQSARWCAAHVMHEEYRFLSFEVEG